MFPSEIETRYTTQRHLKGGVAPSRHALARQVYLERQNRLAKENPLVSATAVLGPVLSYVIARVTSVLNQIGAFWSTGHRVPR